MKILVLNGSPKGQYSITLQTCRYWEILHPEHSFTYLEIATRIRQWEKDLTPALEAMNSADLVIFSYPVYTFLLPSQLHRFVELLKEGGHSFPQTYTLQISTSKHFYDTTAHAFLRENCLDLGFRCLEGLSADMDDLTKPKGQAEARAFFDHALWCVQQGLYEGGSPRPLAPARQFPVTPAAGPEDKSGDVVLVADLAPEDRQLAAMIDRFRAVFPRRTRLINIHDFPFQGGCINCFRCCKDGRCFYTDGFQELLRDEIQTAEATVLAFSIRDHAMGSRFKTYDDRQFCNGHRTVSMGKPFGYLISGNLGREENLRTVLKARAQVGGNYLAGLATDEENPDRAIDALAANLAYALDHSYTQPSNFWGVGGMKIFRDLIWLMQGVMRADHAFFKAHGQYDFPQKKRGTMLAMYAAGAMLNNPKLRKKLGSRLNDGMLAAYTKVLEEAKAGCKEDTQV